MEGYRTPSNIVLGPDGYYYALFEHLDWSSDVSGSCVMRTDALSDPASWRAWNGIGFDLPLTSPYVTGSSSDVCQYLTMPDGDAMHDTASLSYNTYLGGYLWVGLWGDWVSGKLVCGFYFATSFDLVNWSHFQIIAKVLNWCETDPQTPGLIEPVRVGYPSIVDHEDSSANFERSGRTPYLYYTRFNDGLDRDLVRVPLTFTLAE
jgi:hypothetical protein